MQRCATIIAVLALSAPPLAAADPPHTTSAAKLAACSSPKLSAATAIRIALADLEHRKVDTSNLAPPTAACSVTAKGNTWSVFFGQNPAMPLGCFWVSVDDDTEKVNSVHMGRAAACAV